MKRQPPVAYRQAREMNQAFLVTGPISARFVEYTFREHPETSLKYFDDVKDWIIYERDVNGPLEIIRAKSLATVVKRYGKLLEERSGVRAKDSRINWRR